MACTTMTWSWFRYYIVLFSSLSLPQTVGQVYIEKLADYILVKTTFGFSLAWDGISGIYLKLSEEHRGKSCGLCANYNGIQSDDFVIHQGKKMEHEKGVGPLESSSFGQQQLIARIFD